MLEIKNINYSYNKKNDSKFKGLNNINIKLRRGKLLLLIGPNGAGKTTLLDIIAGIKKPKSGQILLNNKSLYQKKRLNKKITSHIGYVLQNVETQFFNDTVEKEISFPLNKDNKETNKKIVNKILQATNLKEKSEMSPFSLSGGEKKRLGVAIFLTKKPKILILDEPTAGLDAYSLKKIFQIFKRLLKNGTILVISTHNLEIFLPFADKVIFLNNGIPKFQGNLMQLGLKTNIFKENHLPVPFIWKMFYDLKKDKYLPLNASVPRSTRGLIKEILQKDKKK